MIYENTVKETAIATGSRKHPMLLYSCAYTILTLARLQLVFRSQTLHPKFSSQSGHMTKVQFFDLQISSLVNKTF